MSKILIIILIFLPTFPSLSQNSISDSLAKDLSYREANIDSLIDSRLSKQIDYIIRESTSAQQHFELANKIIDWSAMIFGAFAILIIVAGIFGLKEFSKIYDTEKQMKKSLDKIKQELTIIENYKSEIMDQTKRFMEITYFLNEGISAYHSGRYLKSKELLYKVIEYDENHLLAHFYIGKCLTMEKQNEEALKLFNKMVGIDPSFAKAYVGLALSTYRTDKDAAIRNCKIAESQITCDAGDLETTGYIYLLLGYFENSFMSFLRSHNMQRSSTNSYFLAILYLIKEDKGSAKKYFNESKYLAELDIEKAKKVHWAYFKMSVIEALNNKKEESIALINLALKANNSPEVKELMRKDIEIIFKYQNSVDTISYLLELLKI